MNPTTSFSSHFEDIQESPNKRWNSLYVTTNELNVDNVFNLTQHHYIHGNALMGVSGLYTLDLLAKRQFFKYSCEPSIEYLIMMDTSDVVQEFWADFKSLMIESSDRKDFLKKFRSLFVDQKTNYFNWSENATFEQRENYFLMSKSDCFFMRKNKYFEIARQIFLNDKFVFICLDLTHDETCQKLAAKLTALKISVDILYLSNIKSHIPQKKLANFGESIKHLAQSNSLIIDTETPRFFTTRYAARLAQTLYKVDALSHVMKKTLRLPETQRLNARGISIEDLMPIIPFQKRMAEEQKDPEDLFFEYGIAQGYYPDNDE